MEGAERSLRGGKETTRVSSLLVSEVEIFGCYVSRLCHKAQIHNLTNDMSISKITRDNFSSEVYESKAERIFF